ncbi:hypothetical protein FCULG_00007424 [Fusarium culmorum]|uniref:Uncharacterized protein n=1 Tax=Fusarium culmorum TaxID=5516 RepID=A0A2T4H2P3_FUSCU|nr:hypothetical protein FCULG_00007424 [Fusarium culmorum]
MLCENVGETNPDIAGLGIFIAFAFQAGVSVILSICSMLLWKDVTAVLSDPDGPMTVYPQMVQWIQQVTKRDFATQLDRFRKRCEENSFDIKELEKAKIDKVLKMISDIQILNVFLIRIGKWDPAIPGYCYNSPTIAILV